MSMPHIYFFGKVEFFSSSSGKQVNQALQDLYPNWIYVSSRPRYQE